MKLKYLSRIIEYLQGEMSESDRLQFELELDENEDLKWEFDLVNSIDDDLKTIVDIDDIVSAEDYDEADLLAKKILSESEDYVTSIDHKIPGALNESTPYRPTVSIRKRDMHSKNRYILLAGMAASFIIGILIYNIFFRSISTDTLYAQFYNPMILPSEYVRSGKVASTGILSTALNFYTNGKYLEADSLVSLLPDQKDYANDVPFYSGIINMGKGDFKVATMKFEEYLNGPGNYFLEAKWYLSLCYLKTGDVHRARKGLAELSRSKGNYRKDALKLLRRLNQGNQ